MKTFKFLFPIALLVLVACNSREKEKEGDHDNHQQSEMKDEQKVNREDMKKLPAKYSWIMGKNGRLIQKPLPVSTIWPLLCKKVFPGKLML